MVQNGSDKRCPSAQILNTCIVEMKEKKYTVG